MQSKLKIGGMFHCRILDVDGTPINEFDAPNTATFEGVKYMLGAYFCGAPQQSEWYTGLIAYRHYSPGVSVYDSGAGPFAIPIPEPPIENIGSASNLVDIATLVSMPFLLSNSLRLLAQKAFADMAAANAAAIEADEAFLAARDYIVITTNATRDSAARLAIAHADLRAAWLQTIGQSSQSAASYEYDYVLAQLGLAQNEYRVNQVIFLSALDNLAALQSSSTVASETLAAAEAALASARIAVTTSEASVNALINGLASAAAAGIAAAAANAGDITPFPVAAASSVARNGWLECPFYGTFPTPPNRPQWAPAATSKFNIGTPPGFASFTFSDKTLLKGAFLISRQPSAQAGGVLFSTALFPGVAGYVSVDAGQTMELYYTVSTIQR
jgi:hypothetical protein